MGPRVSEPRRLKLQAGDKSGVDACAEMRKKGKSCKRRGASQCSNWSNTSQGMKQKEKRPKYERSDEQRRATLSGLASLDTCATHANTGSKREKERATSFLRHFENKCLNRPARGKEKWETATSWNVS